MKSFDLLSWNILHGGGKRLPGILEAILTIDADVVTLCEFKQHAVGKKVLNELQSHGYTHIQCTQSTASENGICIASKLPGIFSLYPEADPRFPHAVISISFEDLDLYSVYFPHKKKHKLFDFFRMHLKKNSKPHIITGDMNTGINGMDQKGNSFWYENDFKNLLANHATDCFRHLHGNAEVYSWYSHQGNGFRYDHTLISPNLLPHLKAFEYLEMLRTQKLSDHSPMYVVLGA